MLHQYMLYVFNHIYTHTLLSFIINWSIFKVGFFPISLTGILKHNIYIDSTICYLCKVWYLFMYLLTKLMYRILLQVKRLRNKQTNKHKVQQILIFWKKSWFRFLVQISFLYSESITQYKQKVENSDILIEIFLL